MNLPPHLRPIDVNRTAVCRECGGRIFARAGDVFPAQGVAIQRWRHWDLSSWGSVYCRLEPESGYSMALVDVTSIEWVKDFAPVFGFHEDRVGNWAVVVPFGGRHKAVAA